jgi:acyl-CoA synthetase (AMP-forming)/AMP-acid ligase II
MFFPGLPKPVFVSQTKECQYGACTILVNLNADDVLYTPLPLYHSSGSGLGLSAVLLTGKDTAL